MIRKIFVFSSLLFCLFFSTSQASDFEACVSAKTQYPSATVRVCDRAGGCGNSNNPGCAISALCYAKDPANHESSAVIVDQFGHEFKSLYNNVGQLGDVGLDPAVSLNKTVEIFRHSKCAQDTSTDGNACVRIRDARTGALLSWTTLQCK